MIWTLRVECISGMHWEEECIRIIEIDSKSSLIDLHYVILDSVDFDEDHLFRFFAGSNPRDFKIKFDSGTEWEESFENYKNTTLDSIYPLPDGCMLYYHFDFGDDWYFEIVKSQATEQEPESGVDYPRVVEEIGPNPHQYGKYDVDPEEEFEETDDL
jgi:hypothetical protein